MRFGPNTKDSNSSTKNSQDREPAERLPNFMNCLPISRIEAMSGEWATLHFLWLELYVSMSERLLSAEATPSHPLSHLLIHLQLPHSLYE